MEVLADNLRRLRRQAGLTQQELAKRAGLPRATLASMEQPDANPGIAGVLAVAQALALSVDQLLLPAPEQRFIKVAADDIQEYRAADGHFVARLVSPIAAKGVQIQMVTMYPGCRSVGRPHPQGAQEFYYSWQGRAQLVIAGESVLVEPGALVQFPGHLKHVYGNPDSAQVHQGVSVVVLPLA